MTVLQNDLVEIYNNLTIFSKVTLDPKNPKPIKVCYKEDEGYQVVFEQEGTSVRLGRLIYYCLGLEDLGKITYLLPEDYDYLMSTLQSLIASGELIKERTALSPENYGFDIYGVDLKQFGKGPTILGQVRFVSGTSWLFKLITKYKYRNVL